MSTDAARDALNHSGIYAIVCEPTGKRYIGQAANLRQRWADHRKTLRRNSHKNRYLQRAFNKYGESAFSFRVLEKCACGGLTEREQHWIDQYSWGRLFNLSPASTSTRGIKRGPVALANIRAGVKKRQLPHWTDQRRAEMAERSRNRIWTPEMRARLSAATKGKKRSAESCARIAAAAKLRGPHPKAVEALRLSLSNRVFTPEIRQHLSEAAVIRWRKLKARGYTATPETRLKLSLSHRGKKQSDETKQKHRIAALARYSCLRK